MVATKTQDYNRPLYIRQQTVERIAFFLILSTPRYKVLNNSWNLIIHRSTPRSVILNIERLGDSSSFAFIK